MRRLACKTVFVDRIRAEGLQPPLDRTDFKIGCCTAITSLHFSRVRGRCRYRHIGIGGCTRRKYARNAKSFVTRARKERGPRSGFRSWHFALTLAWKINFTGEKLESERCCTDRLNVVRGNYMLKYIDVLIYKCMRVCMYVHMNSKGRRSLKKNFFVIPRS